MVSLEQRDVIVKLITDHVKENLVPGWSNETQDMIDLSEDGLDGVLAMIFHFDEYGLVALRRIASEYVNNKERLMPWSETPLP